jgi:hypothetical protein
MPSLMWVVSSDSDGHLLRAPYSVHRYSSSKREYVLRSNMHAISVVRSHYDVHTVHDVLYLSVSHVSMLGFTERRRTLFYLLGMYRL